MTTTIRAQHCVTLDEIAAGVSVTRECVWQMPPDTLKPLALALAAEPIGRAAVL